MPFKADYGRARRGRFKFSSLALIRDLTLRSTTDFMLQLSGVSIRPWTLDDAAALQRHANNRNIWLQLRDLFPHPYTLQDAHNFLSHLMRQEPLVTFAIATQIEPIGCIGLRLGEDVHRHTAELGYWLAEPFWGRGIMTEAVAKFTDYVFATLPLRRIYSELFSNNPASARVLEKAGFQFEARLRSSVTKNGQVLDSLLFARINEKS